MPEDRINDGVRTFANYVNDRKTNVQLQCDGGQLMFDLIINGNSFLACSSGRLSKPKIAILGVAGRANHDGWLFDGSAAQFTVKQLRWLDQPEMVIRCLNDEGYVDLAAEKAQAAKSPYSCMAPYRVDIL
jgi:hypothetical protein